MLRVVMEPWPRPAEEWPGVVTLPRSQIGKKHIKSDKEEGKS